jgi:trafficking protein particle complex subunit 2
VQTGKPAPVRTPLQFSLLLSSTLDVFEARSRHAAASNTLLSGEFGLLHAVDERLAAYGFETNTGVKFVAVVDMRGRILDRSSAPGAASAGSGGNAGATPSGTTTAATGTGSGPSAASKSAVLPSVGLRDGELKVVFRAMQTAYVQLLQNPFYEPDETVANGGQGARRITSRKFADEMRRIGDVWIPGGANL